MTERREYDEATKAAVVAALLAGQSISEIAEKYRLPEGTVKSWKNRQKDSPVATVATQKRAEIGVMLFDYLCTILVSMKAQAEFFGDKEWLSKQNAADAGVLHGIGVDKAIRLLEAFANTEEEGE